MSGTDTDSNEPEAVYYCDEDTYLRMKEELARLRNAVESWQAEEADWKAEEKRLWGIEAAVVTAKGRGPHLDANVWRQFAIYLDTSGLHAWAFTCDAIADALEVKP